MTSIKPFLYILIAGFAFLSCESEEIARRPMSPPSTMLMDLVNLEINVFMDNRETYAIYINSIEDDLVSNRFGFCSYETDKLSHIIVEFDALENELEDLSQEQFAQKLRRLRLKLAALDTQDDYVTYFTYLWDFENTMAEAVEVGKDPMLNLYDWNEFESVVGCMNEKWDNVMMRQMKAQILLDDKNKKVEYIYKLALNEAVDEFNFSMYTDEYEKFRICDYADKLENAYYNYLKSISPSYKADAAFLALL